MKKMLRGRWIHFAPVAATIVLVAGSAALFADTQAQSSKDVSASSTIVLLTGDHSVHLSAGTGTCTANTGDGNGVSALAISEDGRNWCWTTYSAIPSPLDVRITPDQIAFRHDARTYVIRDASTVASARELFAPVHDAMEKQADSRRRMDQLRLRDGSSPSFSEMRVSVPDLTTEFQKVEADAKRLSFEGGTQLELSELQSELSELQGRISELESEASERKSEFEAQKGALNSQMSAMGLQIRAMSEEMQVWSSNGEKAAEQAARGLKSLLDQAIASGIAKEE